MDKVQFFKDRVLFWKEKLLLHDKEYIVTVQDSLEDARAQFVYNATGQLVTVEVGKAWLNNEDTSLLDIDTVCFHEMFESQFGRIYECLDRFYSNEYGQELIHPIVHRMSCVIFDRLRDVK